jgi:pantoate--beta-alanine ligase
MQIFHDINEWRAYRHSLPNNTSLGFVPTMGHLHPGHVSLFAASQRENDCTVASIFVNPTQFNRSDDFTHYPRTLEADFELLTKASVDYCLLPTEASIYPDNYHYQLQENHLSLLMEGKQRPGHFTGVLTVVMKLLNLVKARRAYFGEKDYQQLQLIRQMTQAFFIDTDIIPCPTIREASGLAYSSRNSRLTNDQRQLADQFAHVFHQPSRSKEQLMQELNRIGVDVEYLEEHEGRRFIAVNFGDVRLIDNQALGAGTK